MPRKVYQTRFVGYAPDPERLHDPRPQLVYEVDPKPKSEQGQPFRLRWAWLAVPALLLILRYVLQQS
ncbi:MAG: hypothetical protein NW206_07675 [Hyphomonadaceae bacterium]|nr:hypothetical protein [Hyphomonadaceae bacterium]